MSRPMKGPPVLLRLSRGFVTSRDLKIFLISMRRPRLKEPPVLILQRAWREVIAKDFWVCLIKIQLWSTAERDVRSYPEISWRRAVRSREKWHFTVAVERRSGNYDTAAIPAAAAAASCLLLLRFSPVFAWSNPLGTFQLQFVPFCLFFLERFRLHASCNSWCV